MSEVRLYYEGHEFWLITSSVNFGRNIITVTYIYLTSQFRASPDTG